MDEHAGFTGGKSTANVYKLKLPAGGKGGEAHAPGEGERPLTAPTAAERSGFHKPLTFPDRCPSDFAFYHPFPTPQVMKFTALLATLAIPLMAASTLAESEAEKANRMLWFDDARFGMFIHWGVYADTGGESTRQTSRRPRRVDSGQRHHPRHGYTPGTPDDSTPRKINARGFRRFAAKGRA